MDTRQAGKADWVFIFLLFGFAAVFILSWHDHQPAPFEEVQQLVAEANANPNAKAVVTEGLKQSPLPTNEQLRDLRGKVDEVLTKQLAESVTGIEVKPEVPRTVDVDTPEWMNRLTWAGLSMVFMCLGYLVFRRVFS